MKRYIKYFLLTALILPFSACKEEFLEFVPEDQATVGTWYKNETEIRQSTAVLYGGRTWWRVNDQFTWLAGDALAGDLHHNWTAEGQFYLASFNSSNQYIGEGWQGFYNVVTFSNLIIDDMPGIASSNGVPESVINKALGEARFMRGVAYFMLAEYWGEVPIIEKAAEKVGSNNLKLPKNTLASVYEFARRDLAFAAENLPTTDEPGRVTSWAAKGMLAKLHVTLGQRSVGGGSVGSAQDFSIAAGYASDVINNSGLELYPNYEDMFKIENEHNPEILFATQLINGGWGMGSSRYQRFARSAEVNGGTDGWGGGKGMSLNYQNNVEANAEAANDLRRKAIYMQLGDYYDYINTEDGGYTYWIDPAEPLPAEGVSVSLTHLKKHVVGGLADHGFALTNQDSPLDIYFLRLADVYLLLAEAELGASTSLSSGAGYNAYLAVRARAGLNPPSDGNMTFIDLFNERRVEFGLESQSWLDVKRRYYRNADETLAYLNSQNRTHNLYRIDSDDALANDPAGYEMVPPGGIRTERTDQGALQYNTDPEVVFTHDKMTLPIPAPEVVANQLLRPEAEAVEYVFE